MAVFMRNTPLLKPRKLAQRWVFSLFVCLFTTSFLTSVFEVMNCLLFGYKSYLTCECPASCHKNQISEEAYEAIQLQAQIHCQMMDHWGAKRERAWDERKKWCTEIYYTSKKLLERPDLKLNSILLEWPVDQNVWLSCFMSNVQFVEDLSWNMQ